MDANDLHGVPHFGSPGPSLPPLHGLRLFRGHERRRLLTYCGQLLLGVSVGAFRRQGQSHTFGSSVGYAFLPIHLEQFAWWWERADGVSVWLNTRTYGRLRGTHSGSLGMPRRFGCFGHLLGHCHCLKERSRPIRDQVLKAPASGETSTRDARRSGCAVEPS